MDPLHYRGLPRHLYLCKSQLHLHSDFTSRALVGHYIPDYKQRSPNNSGGCRVYLSVLDVVLLLQKLFKMGRRALRGEVWPGIRRSQKNTALKHRVPSCLYTASICACGYRHTWQRSSLHSDHNNGDIFSIPGLLLD